MGFFKLKNCMQIIDLFSGIGGFSYAGHSLGWNTVQMVEYNPFCQRVLKHHFPEAAIHSDIKTFNIDELRKSKWNPNQPSIITGGFPCQPYSAAGKRQGKDDERHLWPEMLRVIREVHPRWVVGENVLGIISWNGGMVFDEVQADLEAEGYEVWAYVLPACGVDAPHQRFRVWFVAYSESGRTGGLRDETEAPRPCQSGDVFGSGGRIQCESRATADSNEQRLEGESRAVGELERFFGFDSSSPHGYQLPDWKDYPTVSPIRSGNDGLPEELVDITFPKWRNESIKALGNSIVPQVALQIFKSIEEYEHNIHLYS